jgi:hypothetical protein
MTATILTQEGLQGSTNADGEIVAGHYEFKQDPLTGEIIRTWVIEDVDPVTPGTQEKRVKCIVRSIPDGGIRVAGTTERITPQGLWDSADYAKMQAPPSVKISKRDRVTNVTNRKGIVVWREEEFDNKPTVFEVLGVNPVFDPFGNHIENNILLQRAEVQGG